MKTRFFQIGILAALAMAAAACSDSSSNGKTSGGAKTTTGGTTAGTGNSTGSTATTTAGTASGGTTASTTASTGPTTGTTTATSGSTTGGSAGALAFNPMGWVDRTSNSLEIQGAFYAYGDSLGPTGAPPGDCQGAGFMTAQCSAIAMTVNATSICGTGTGAMVINGTDGMPAYSQIWGAGIGFDLNNSGGDASVKSPYNAMTHHVVGVSFDIDNVPAAPAQLRVEFPTPAMATAAHYVIVNDSGHVDARFSDAGVFYLNPPDTSAIDTTMINSFQWHVATATSGAVPFTFCLSNITPIVE